MEDVMQQETAEPLTAPQQITVEPQPLAVVKRTDNLIQNHKRLSLLAQIYNWQPTPISVRVNLPIQPYNNIPLLAFEATPFWIPMFYFTGMQDMFSQEVNNERIWEAMRPWIFPVSKYTLATEAPSGLAVIEKDNMPDISWHALHHLGWSGTIQLMFRVISNVTTQGKLSFSRQYNIQRDCIAQDPSLHRTKMYVPLGSMTTRKKNSFMILDLSRTTDLQVNIPYMENTPFKHINNYLFNNWKYSPCAPASFIFLDIVDILDKSAGANEFIMDVWIKAGPDFKLHMPIPPNSRDLFSPTAGPSANDAIYSYPRFIDRNLDFVPLVYGQGTNVTFDANFRSKTPGDVPAPTTPAVDNYETPSDD